MFRDERPIVKEGLGYNRSSWTIKMAENEFRNEGKDPTVISNA